MDPRAGSLRETIAATRAAMTKKIAMLEMRIQQSVDEVKSTAGEFIDQTIVKLGTPGPKIMEEARAVVEQYPWLIVGGGILWGYLLGRTGDRPSALPTPQTDGAGAGSRSGGSRTDRSVGHKPLSPQPEAHWGTVDIARERLLIHARQASTQETSPGRHVPSRPRQRREPKRATLGEQLREVWELGGLSAKELARRVIREIQHDDCTGRAAELAYYFLFALFPFFLFLTTLLGYLPVPNLLDRILELLAQFLPGEALTLIQDNVRQLVTDQRGGLLSFGFLAALWTSSSAITAVMEGLNRAYEVEEERPFWKVRGLAVLLTIGLSLLIIVAMILLTFGPQIGGWIAGYMGLGSLFEVAWNLLRWPVVVCFLIFAMAVLYYVGPDVEQEWKWITPGSVWAVLGWIVAALGFAFYVNNFGSYNKTYGSIGAVIVLLTWMYVAGFIILVGGEINSEIEHAAPGGKAPGEKQLPRT
jgi:membrane protein